MAVFTDKLRAIMALEPDRAALDYNGTEYSWGTLAKNISRIERTFETLGLPPEARVGVALRNRPGFIAAFAAVLASDRCLVTLNPLLPDARLAEDILSLALPGVLLSNEDLARSGIADAVRESGAAMIVIDGYLEKVDAMAAAAQSGATQVTAPGVAIEMLTSGTTGTPKRVPLSRASFDASFAGFTAYERDRDFTDAPRLRSGVTMVVNPLTHIGGIYGAIGTLMNGRKMALLERFTVDEWVGAVRRNRPKVAPAVPSAIRMLLDSVIDPADLSSLSAIISGTAPLSPDLVDSFLERFGVPVLANYGATEFAGAIAGWTLDDFRAHWQEKRGAVGRIHANVAARVVDEATGTPVAHGAEGLLELKGDQLGPQYRLEGEKWLRTTDRAVLDADNFLYIKGRADNAIVRGGFKVQPDDVVAALCKHPAVREAAVVGIADDRLGQVPAAVLILKDGETAPDAETVRQWLRDRLLPYQVPTQFRFVPDFPRTPSMKPSAPALRALFEQGDVT